MQQQFLKQQQRYACCLIAEREHGARGELSAHGEYGSLGELDAGDELVRRIVGGKRERTG